MNVINEIKKINLRELELGIEVGKGSWHDRYSHSSYVYVGGLDYALTEGDVLTIFSQYGEIVDVNLVRDKETGKSQGFAFIGYANQRSTVLAVDNFTGAKVLGRPLRVDHVDKYKVKSAGKRKRGDNDNSDDDSDDDVSSSDSEADIYNNEADNLNPLVKRMVRAKVKQEQQKQKLVAQAAEQAARAAIDETLAQGGDQAQAERAAALASKAAAAVAKQQLLDDDGDANRERFGHSFLAVPESDEKREARALKKQKKKEEKKKQKKAEKKKLRKLEQKAEEEHLQQRLEALKAARLAKQAVAADPGNQQLVQQAIDAAKRVKQLADQGPPPVILANEKKQGEEAKNVRSSTAAAAAAAAASPSSATTTTTTTTRTSVASLSSTTSSLPGQPSGPLKPKGSNPFLKKFLSGQQRPQAPSDDRPKKTGCFKCGKSDHIAKDCKESDGQPLRRR